MHVLKLPIRRLARDEDGAVLVEFALIFPVTLLFFAITIEATRMMWSYQMAIEGIRDAGRYLARIAPVDICETGGSLAGYAGDLRKIVEEDIDGNLLFPSLITVGSVTPEVECIDGTYRTDPAPIATVSAELTLEFPFGRIFGLFGAALSTVTTTVTDTARIYGQ